MDEPLFQGVPSPCYASHSRTISQADLTARIPAWMLRRAFQFGAVRPRPQA
ncbi:hypothetical protein JG688_00008691 [Phytophthora aleatoria]|uniref:Uncharacterized protein n=1 Tax=Phytophthora aleatoria TaxID=2496075 RepID=A0A8J5M4H1_9STRA|nr:hypothetical protein JG688_00008691 [Phytophthora aleatoria]